MRPYSAPWVNGAHRQAGHRRRGQPGRRRDAAASARPWVHKPPDHASTLQWLVGSDRRPGLPAHSGIRRGPPPPRRHSASSGRGRLPWIRSIHPPAHRHAARCSRGVGALAHDAHTSRRVRTPMSRSAGRPHHAGRQVAASRHPREPSSTSLQRRVLGSSHGWPSNWPGTAVSSSAHWNGWSQISAGAASRVLHACASYSRVWTPGISDPRVSRHLNGGDGRSSGEPAVPVGSEANSRSHGRRGAASMMHSPPTSSPSNGIRSGTTDSGTRSRWIVEGIGRPWSTVGGW